MDTGATGSARADGEVDARVPPASAAPVLRIRHRVSNGELIAAVTLCLAAVLLSAWGAHDGEVANWERHTLVWFNDWPDWLEPVFWFVQQFGLLFAPLVVGTVVAIAARRWQLIVPFALVLPLKLLFEKGLVKSFLERERPFTSVGPEIVVRGDAYEGLSFPSGHTTTAFATAVLLFALLPPRWRVLPLVWAVLVGIARLYMGEHNVLDVVSGAAIGTLFAMVIWRFVLEHPAIAGTGRLPIPTP